MAVQVLVIAFAVVSIANFPTVVGEFELGTALSWGLAAFQKSDTGTAVSKKLSSLKDMPELLYTNTDRFLNRMDSMSSTFLGECDGMCLVDIIKKKLIEKRKLVRIPKSKCLNGLKFTVKEEAPGIDKDITMSDGFITIIKDKIVIEGFSDGRVEDAEDKSHTLFIGFNFPDLTFSYDFLNKPKSIRGGKERKGTVQYLLKGPNRLVLRVRVSKAIDAVKEEAKTGKCFVRIREVIFELANQIQMADVSYNSLTQNNLNIGFTQTTLEKLATQQFVVEGFKASVKTSLKKVLEPIMQEKTIFCDDKSLSVAAAPKCGETTTLNDEVADPVKG